jgi:hypothetical protein
MHWENDLDLAPAATKTPRCTRYWTDPTLGSENDAAASTGRQLAVACSFLTHRQPRRRLDVLADTNGLCLP